MGFHRGVRMQVLTTLCRAMSSDMWEVGLRNSTSCCVMLCFIRSKSESNVMLGIRAEGFGFPEFRVVGLGVRGLGFGSWV